MPQPFTRKLIETKASRPWTPGGQLLLREALDRFGRAFLEDAWTGEEMEARMEVFDAPGPPVLPEPYYRAVKKPDGSSEIIARKLPCVVAGRQEFLPFEQAMALYEREKDELVQLWEKEQAALRRLVSMIDEFRKALFAQHLPARILTNDGELHEVPVAVWAGRDVRQVFRTGVAKFTVGFGYSTFDLEGIVLIPEGRLDDYLRRSFGPKDAAGDQPPETAEGSTAATVAGEKADGQLMKRTGRAPKYKWEDCWLQICVFSYKYGLPETQAELVRHLAQWFSAEFDEVPAESEIKKRVSAVFRAFEVADKSD